MVGTSPGGHAGPSMRSGSPGGLLRRGPTWPGGLDSAGRSRRGCPLTTQYGLAGCGRAAGTSAESDPESWTAMPLLHPRASLQRRRRLAGLCRRRPVTRARDTVRRVVKAGAPSTLKPRARGEGQRAREGHSGPQGGEGPPADAGQGQVEDHGHARRPRGPDGSRSGSPGRRRRPTRTYRIMTSEEGQAAAQARPRRSRSRPADAAAVRGPGVPRGLGPVAASRSARRMPAEGPGPAYPGGR